MNRGMNKIHQMMYRVGMIGGGLIFGYAFLEPYMPFIITIALCLAAGLGIRALLVRARNKKFNQTYRYTNPAGAQRQSTKTNAGSNAGANTRERVNAGTNAKDDANRRKDDPPPPPPPNDLTPYRNLLGLGHSFTPEELKAAYRAYAAQYHPDRYVNASEAERRRADDMMKCINEAYQRLKG